MKIDLHIHTKRCKQGDSKHRNINTLDFINKMYENNVSLCSITNHNHFNLVEYNEILSHDPQFSIFPGIELDVKKDDKQYHIILICNPNSKEKFKYIFDPEDNRDYDKYVLEYSAFLDRIKQFTFNEIIIIPHLKEKDNKRGFSKLEKSILEDDLSNYLMILEPRKLQTMGVINAHNELSLIGSDVTDWRKYNQYDLPELKFKINTFQKFYELAANTEHFITKYLEQSQKYDVPIFNKDYQLKKELKIYEDINIVFGEKGSGKTKILKDSLLKYFKESPLKTVHHEGADYANKFKNLIKNYESSINVEEQNLDIIKENYQKLIDYSDPLTTNFISRFRVYRQNVNKNKNAKLLTKADARFSKVQVKSQKEVFIELDRKLQKIKEIQIINENLRSDTDQKRYFLNNELKSLSYDIKIESINKIRKIFIENFVDIFLKELESSIKKKTGKESKPKEIGFSKLITSRLNRVAANSTLKKELHEAESTNSITLGSLPNKGQIKLTTSIIVLKKNYTHVKGSPFRKKGIEERRNLIGKIFEFESCNFNNINTYFSQYEKDISAEEFVKEFIKKDTKFSIKGNEDYELSEGEQAIITISALLEDDSYDIYLFDEIERGLGQKYISDYIIPKLKEQRDKGKIIIASTHNSNIAINTLPSQTIYCDYKVESNEIYYSGNMFAGILSCLESNVELSWDEKALTHLEGSEEMFNKRRNIYGI